MNLIIDAVIALIQTGMNLTGQKREYMEWRMSPEGKKYFSQAEENAFYEALAKGDDNVISVGIQQKQARINELKKELGLD